MKTAIQQRETKLTQPIRSLVGAALLLAGTALPGLAQDQTISWIYCGDTIDPVHTKYIGEWEKANPGWKVAPELVITSTLKLLVSREVLVLGVTRDKRLEERVLQLT